MKLELKHLAPYLPYGLQIKILNHKCDYVGIEFSKSNGFYFIGESLHLAYEGGATGKDIDTFKPILRSLHNLNEGNLQSIQGRELDISLDKDLEWFITDSEHYYPSGNYSIPKDIWLGNYEYLVQNHFDIFGLIEKDLAIDFNTI